MSHPLPDDARTLCGPFLAALPVDHVAIATLGDPFDIRTVCATDPLAARLSELELDYGEGPAWRAKVLQAPVLAPDLRSADAAQWPVLAAAITAYPVLSVYAFPLTVGMLFLGAVDLYAAAPDVLDGAQVDIATSLATTAALEMLRTASDPDDREGAAHGRRTVHQATGMVIAQLRVSAEDALLVIRGHAFAEGRSVSSVAADVVARRIVFSD